MASRRLAIPVHGATVRAVSGHGVQHPGGAGGGGMGRRPYSFASAPGRSLARADAELAVGGGEVLLDGLVAHVERLGDLPVRASRRGERGDPPFVGGERVDSAELRPARPRAGDQQLGPGALGERRGVAADREIERLAERLAGVDDAAAVTERDAEVGERAGVLEPGR